MIVILKISKLTSKQQNNKNLKFNEYISEEINVNQTKEFSVNELDYTDKHFD